MLTLDEMPQEIQSIQTGGGGTSSGEEYKQLVERTITSVSDGSISKVGEGAYSYCDILASATLSNATLVEARGFYRCTNLLAVSLPSVTTLGEYAFNGSTKLEEITLPALSKTDSYAFQNCSSLIKVDLPVCAAIRSYGVFADTNLQTLILRRESTICTLSATSSFSSTPIASGTGYIYVPSALLEQYKVATNWAIYANQFRAIEDYPEICGGES